MEFDGFDWDRGNSTKCQKHGVSRAEIESLFFGKPIVGPDPYPAERRFRAAGRTAKGRALFVVFTWRTHDGEDRVRPISARYMHGKEIEAYEEKIP
jgi:uncharacterized DUF497 family protein